MEKEQKHVAVIGAGIAGLHTANLLAQSGHKVTILEKEKYPGGHLNQWHHLFPDHSSPEWIISGLLDEQLQFDHLKMISSTEITSIEKNNGHFAINAGNELRIYADAVVISTGFKLFDARQKEEYGYGLFKNVITSADLEQSLKSGQPLTTASGKTPSRVAFIHCIGSRDAKCGNTYCSKVCCITGVKQALEISEMLPETEIFCFYMDLRLYGSKFDDLYLQAQKKHKIQFIRGRLSEAAETHDKRLQIKAEDTLSGRPLRMEVDMIVLLAGMEKNEAHQMFSSTKLLELDEHGFFKSKNIQLTRNETTQPGIFIAGTCICPMSVNETIENAGAASILVNRYLEHQQLTNHHE
ncbi:MAG: CoB--CoM heterodisulfide reductase iron-sulfur subunit A family protein [Prolixibacteraceae bacterium]|nr:CoB--CoM heterodisulfide reductase iron-sulfur subunit A family protein [Prolixibacteraceae bacterium]